MIYIVAIGGFFGAGARRSASPAERMKLMARMRIWLAIP
jgi:hypothetical protein